MSETKYIKGIFVKSPHQNAPDFVLAQVSINRKEAINTLSGMDDEYINLDVLRSKDGDVYGKINTWKKGQTGQDQNQSGGQTGSVQNDEPITPEEIPF